MTEREDRYELRNRYQFKGQIVMETALHIGGGRATLSSSNSPIVLTPANIPFIPGSSFKGSLRSTVEKLVPSLPSSAALTSCALIDLPEDVQERETQTKGSPKSCPTVRQRAITKVRRAQEQRRQQDNTPEADNKPDNELDYLCNTCRLFGSPFAASRINVSDLYMPENEQWLGGIQVRDGVAIDRDSEKAKDRLKYNFEVVPVSAIFNLSIVLENATPQDLQLISIGLSEFVHGFGTIGGKRSRGLGVCRLDNLTVSSLELIGKDIDEAERSQRLKDYLLNRKFSTENEPAAKFFETHINTIFEPR